MRQVTDPKIPGELLTERLRLRRWAAGDLDELAGLFAQRDVWEYPFGRGFTRAETERFVEVQMAAWDEDGFGRYLVELRATGELAGYAGLQLGRWFPEIADKTEVGWRFGRQHWGRGLATEAARASLASGAAALDLDVVVAVIEPPNLASIKVAERLHMRYVRATTEPMFAKELLVYEIDGVAAAGLLGEVTT